MLLLSYGVLIFVCLLVVMRVREDHEQESAYDLQGQEFDGSEQQWEGKWSLMHLDPFSTLIIT